MRLSVIVCTPPYRLAICSDQSPSFCDREAPPLRMMPVPMRMMPVVATQNLLEAVVASLVYVVVIVVLV